MKTSIKFEELAMFIFGVYLFNSLEISWWWFSGLLLAPDISMLGYLINAKAGAVTYDIFHHKGIAILIYLTGIYFNGQVFQLIGHSYNMVVIPNWSQNVAYKSFLFRLYFVKK